MADAPPELLLLLLLLLLLPRPDAPCPSAPSLGAHSARCPKRPPAHTIILLVPG